MKNKKLITHDPYLDQPGHDPYLQVSDKTRSIWKLIMNTIQEKKES